MPVKFHLDDTIGALASPPGPGARGIIRASGPAVVSSIGAFFEPTDLHRWNSLRHAAVHAGTFRLGPINLAAPVSVYCWPNSRSYTGQPLAEIHAPGSPPLLERILSQLLEAGVRAAAPGEFTLRAFLAGRIDLLQAEAILGVIDAPSAGQLSAALGQLAGGISRRIAGVREDLLNLLADLEAGLDFVDEGIEFVPQVQMCHRLQSAQHILNDLLAQCDARMHSRGRRQIVLVGLPNAGKSTLFNALLARDVALVSPLAGTTRDYLHGETDWHGLAIELYDTPGWQDDPMAIMSHAQALGQDLWTRADLLVWCSPCDLDAEQARCEAAVLARLHGRGLQLVVARTKADLLRSPTPSHALPVSAFSREGFAGLTTACVDALSGRSAASPELVGTTAARCRESLVRAGECLSRARIGAASRLGDELLALEIRESLDALGQILGTIYTDDVLDRIFSRFCIGK
jgi:tRNA modification GTPase